MNILYRLTQNTFRECVREPVFYLLQLVGLVLIGILPMFSMFVFREQIKLVVDSSMATTMVLGLIAAALCSSHTITREMRNGTVLLLLSKPVPRYTFIVAKLIGVTMALTVFTFALIAASFVAVMIARDQFQLDFTAMAFYYGLLLVCMALAGALNYLKNVPFTSASTFILAVALPIFAIILFAVRGAPDDEGFIPPLQFVSALVLPQIISEFNRLYPGVDVKLSEGNIAYLEEKLFKGDLDLVLDNHPMDEGIYLRELFCSEQLLLAVPANDPVCSRHSSQALTHKDILNGKHTCPQTPAISMDSFYGHTFIALRHGNDTRIQLDFLCEEAGFSPKIQLEVDQLTTAYNIVCNNIGITLVSDTLVTRTPPVSNLVYFKIDSDHTRRFAYFYYKNASYVTLAMREFIKLGIENIQCNKKEDSTY